MATSESTQSSILDVLLVGCGNIGFAFLSNWLGLQADVRVHVVEPSEKLRERAAALGASVSADADGIPSSFEPSIIVLAVKPQTVAALVSRYARYWRAGAVLVSVAAGISVRAMESAAGASLSVVRCVPNTPVAVGAGTLVCYASLSVSVHQRQKVERLIGRAGAIVFVSDETQLDAATAVSGSGPAYLFFFIECLTQAAIAAGLPENLAGQLATQTCYGASLLALRSDVDPAALRRQVTSPNGTTEAAIAVFQNNRGFEAIVRDAVEAAKARSIALGMQEGASP